MAFKSFAFVLLFALPLALRADAEFDTTGSSSDKPAASSPSHNNVAPGPQIMEAGDVPTAYALLKYEMRADVRFYEGGGILSTVNLGIFSRLSIGGGLNVPNLIGDGSIYLTRDDAQLSARLLVLREDESVPALSLGWQGPAYDGGELRGLYLVLSKEFKTPLGYFQVHAGANNSVFDDFVGSRDLRGFAALTSTYQQVTVFFEGDEFGNPDGARMNAGIRAFFDPISLGIEFHDLGGTRNDARVSRLLRVSYIGLF